jgi:hypothetical protein
MAACSTEPLSPRNTTPYQMLVLASLPVSHAAWRMSYVTDKEQIVGSTASLTSVSTSNPRSSVKRSHQRHDGYKRSVSRLFHAGRYENQRADQNYEKHSEQC